MAKGIARAVIEPPKPGEVTREDRWRACRKLADLQGWTGIHPYGNGGQMAGYKKNCSGMEIVPLPTEYWQDCMLLAHKCGLIIDLSVPGRVKVSGAPGEMLYSRHPNADTAIRYAVVVAAIKQLEEKLENEQRQPA